MAEEVDVSEIAKNIKNNINKSLVNGESWYLVDYHWFNQCKKYLGLDEAEDPSEVGSATLHPGPIDNTPLVKEADPSDIKDHLVDEMDYKMVPQEVWDILKDKFGQKEGQEPIQRSVREFGMFVKHCKVEVYYTEFQLAKNETPDVTVKKKFSKADTLGKMQTVMRKEFNIPEDKETRIWNKYTSNTYEILDKLETTVQDAGLFSGQVILIEQKNEDGTWTRKAHSTSSITASNGAHSSTAASSTNSISSPYTPIPPLTPYEKKETSPSLGATTSRYSSYGEGGQCEDGKPGVCGLSNLGNTCFMNSIIQGLSNAPQIAEYFENDNYEEDINEENPLGMKGEIAKTFGQLIKDLWSGRYSYIVPRNFKMAVGRFAPQFSGYQQQDSQELLTFLLDGLHEDLNRIKKKPYIEMSDSDGKDDIEVAREAWENYKQRNDSVILDIFHGLLKSTLVCPECDKVSVTFDPTCYLSLPLPVKKERQIETFFVPLSPSLAPVQYKVTVPKNGIISDLCEALGKMTNVPADRLIATDVYSHRFHKIYTAEEQLSAILERDDIFVYEIPDPEDSSQVVVPVYLREKKSSTPYSPSNLFGQPLLVGIPTKVKYADLYELLLTRMSRYVTRPGPSEEWWKPPPPPAKKEEEDQQQSQVTSSEDEKMEVNGTDSNSDNGAGSEMEAASSTTSDKEAGGGGGASTSSSSSGGKGRDMPVIGGSSENTSPGSGQSPTSETSNGPNIQDDDMASEEDEWAANGHSRLFNLNIVNSYGSSQIQPLTDDDEGVLELTPKNYIALDWHPRAKELFFNDKKLDDFSQDDSFSGRVTVKKQTIPLSECLKMYTNQEKLGVDDAWYCPGCKKHQQATKKFDLWMLPEVLIIHLKRFSYNKYFRDKIDTLIDFPLEGLDMTPFVIQPEHGAAVYDCISVSNHYGGMGGGHYTAYCKNKNDGKWYYFDDSSVTEAKGDIITKAAYVLFYQRRTPSKPNSAAANIPAAAGSPAQLLNGGTAAPMVNGTTNGVSSSDEDMELN